MGARPAERLDGEWYRTDAYWELRAMRDFGYTLDAWRALSEAERELLTAGSRVLEMEERAVREAMMGITPWA